MDVRMAEACTLILLLTNVKKPARILQHHVTGESSSFLSLHGIPFLRSCAVVQMATQSQCQKYLKNKEFQLLFKFIMFLLVQRPIWNPRKSLHWKPNPLSQTTSLQVASHNMPRGSFMKEFVSLSFLTKQEI